MSTTIDQRVVEMRFDNKDFERNCSQTLSTLEKLKQRLNLTGASKGMEEINSAAKRIDMSHLGAGVEAVSAKFSALQVMGITALTNITNQAVNAGKRITSALTIDPIKTGFSEYETQINAVQTILANTESKGTTLNDVNKALDTLNTYADKTIYNFTEMTRNIGTFTAAGVDLDTSVSSIQGIANLAAVSGSTSQQASTAMYQLSQALAAGKVSLMDWNSVVNAGMGGQVFQDALKRTATVMGKDVDGLIKEYGSFRESLTQGEWLTTDVLTKTLEQFTMAAEEGSEEWNNFKKSLIDDGYTEKQAEEILKMANTATNAATKVKTFTQLWDTLKEAAQSGWTQTWEIIVGDFEEAKSLLTNVSDVIGEMIGNSAKARNELLQGWKDAGGRNDLIEGISNAFEGLMNIVNPIKEAFRDIFPPMTVKQLTDFTVGFKDLTAKFKEFTEAHGDQIKNTFKGIFSILDIGVTFVKELAGGALRLVKSFSGLGGGILDSASSIGEWLTNLRDSVKEGDLFGRAIDKITDAVSKGISKLKEFANSVKESFKAPGYNGFLGFLKGIWEFVTKLSTGIAKAFGSIGQIIANIFGDNTFGDVLDSGVFAAFMFGIYKFVDAIRSPFDALSDGLEHITGKEGIFANITGILTDVRGCFKAYQDQLQANTLLKIAGAIGILAAAIFVISTIDPEQLGKTLAAIATLFAQLLGSLAIFTKVGGNLKGVMRAVPLILSFASAILILSLALKLMSTMTLKDMGVALLGLTVSMATLVGAIALLPKKNVGAAAKAIRTLATSMLILSLALKIMGSMSWGEIARGLTAAVVGLAAMVGAINLLPKGLGKRTSGMIAMAISLVILGGALKIMGSMSWSEIGKGLTTLAGSLLAITLAMNLMPKNMLVIGAGLIGVATSLVIVAAALKIMGSMSWEEIAKGLVVLGGALLELGIGLNLMRGTLSGSAALLVAAVALALITPTLMALGKLSWAEIGKGLLMLAGAFAVIGVAGLLLTPIIPALLGLAGAFALFGVATVGIGAGLALIGVGITAVASALAVGTTAIVASISAIVLGLLDLIPNILLGFKDIILAFCEVIVDCAPQIAETILVLVSDILKSLATYTPQIADSLFELLIGLLDVIAARLPELVTAAVKVIGAFFQGVVDALSGVDTTSILQGVIAVGLLSGLMYALSAVAALVPSAMAGLLGIGVIIAEMTLIFAAIGALAQIPGLSWIVEEGGNFLQTLGTAIGKFIGGLSGGIAQGFTSSLPQMGTDLSEFMTNLQPFIDGAKTIDASVMEGVKALAGVVLAITAADVISGLTSWITGGSSITDFGAELAEFGPYMKQYADSIAGIDAQTVVASAIAAKALTEMCASIPNSGGVAAWFAGENSISKFAGELLSLGLGLKGYSLYVTGINTEAIIASASAAKALAEMCAYIPNSGGVAAWFAGDNSISKFAEELLSLGSGLKGFSDSISGIVPENIIAAANAAKSLAQMVNVIPNEGGIKAWFTGDASIATFAEHLPALGSGLKGFSDSISGIVPENITTAAKAATELAKMASVTPVDTYSLIPFGENLIVFGASLKTYFDSVGTVTADSTSNAKRVFDVINSTANMNTTGIKNASSAINSLINALKKMPDITESTVSGFSNAMKKLGSTSVDTISASFNAATPRITGVGGKIVTSLSDGIKARQGVLTATSIALINQTVNAFNSKVGQFQDSANRLMTAFIEGVKTNAPKVSSAVVASVSSALSSINGYYNSFYSAGSSLVDGFAAGISANDYKAAAKAAAMASAAYNAAKKELDINSPSKVFRSLGYSVPEGFAMGIDKLSGMASRSASDMADTTIETVSDSMSRIADAINRDIDAQPTIKPVLDLTNVRNGASSISSMLGFGTSVGLMTNVGAISSGMNRNQNGVNNDVVSAIGKLRKDLNNVRGNTYVIDGITYDDGSNISNAVKDIVRAVRMEGRA